MRTFILLTALFIASGTTLSSCIRCFDKKRSTQRDKNKMLKKRGYPTKKITPGKRN